MTHHPARRAVLGTAALGALGAAPALAGCSTGSGGDEEGVPGSSAPAELGAADAVPVGGAKLYREQKVIVSRPDQDTYEGFSAVCTHQRCVISEIKGTEAHCTCHGSLFDATTGEVRKGPATTPLPSVQVTENGGKLTAG